MDEQRFLFLDFEFTMPQHRKKPKGSGLGLAKLRGLSTSHSR
ncbi:hypothetical protein bcgnr5377_65500 [Bacillus cereus]